MISTNEFRTGVTIELEGDVYSVVEFQHVKPGKGSPFVRAKLRNVKTGSVTERTFRAGEKLNRAHIERREMQYLYVSGDDYIFMDTDNYEQVTMRQDQLGDAMQYLKENTIIGIMFHEGASFGVDLPNTVDLVVSETAPGFRGDTASGGTKPATLETGYVVNVPFFINEGDVVRVDTRSGQYIERV